MSAIAAYPNQRAFGDAGSAGPYLQQEQPRGRLSPWTTDQVGKHAGYGAATGYATSGIYSLLSGLSLAATGFNILGGTLFFGLLGGLARAGYNILKHYKIL